MMTRNYTYLFLCQLPQPSCEQLPFYFEDSGGFVGV